MYWMISTILKISIISVKKTTTNLTFGVCLPQQDITVWEQDFSVAFPCDNKGSAQKDNSWYYGEKSQLGAIEKQEGKVMNM